MADENSIWKKEIAFGRKPKAAPRVAPAQEPVPAAKSSIWKKEISFGRKAKAVPRVAAAREPALGEASLWKKEIAFGRKRKAAPRAAQAVLEPAPAAKTSLWKKEIALGRKAKAKQPKSEQGPQRPSGKVKQPRARVHKKLVGLKIGSSQLAAARIVNGDHPQVVQLARAPLDPGIIVGGELREPEALASALKTFFRKNKIPRGPVRLGVANNRIGVRIFELTGIDDPRQLENAVRFRAQETLPIPLEESVLDYRILRESVNEQGVSVKRVLLVVGHRELIERYAAACRKAGLRLVGVDLEAFALLRALAAGEAPADEDAGLVVVSIGHDRSTLAVSDGKICEFTRVLDWGGSMLDAAVARALDLTPSEAEPIKEALSLTELAPPPGLSDEQAARARSAMRAEVQAFARDLVASLRFYQEQPGSLGIGEIVLTGGGAQLSGLTEELGSLIGVRVRVGDPTVRLKLARRARKNMLPGSLTAAIGLGIEA